MLNGIILIDQKGYPLTLHTGNMVIGSTQKHGPRRRAHTRSVEICHAYSYTCKFVQVWCVNLPAKRPDVRPAKIISDNEQEVETRSFALSRHRLVKFDVVVS